MTEAALRLYADDLLSKWGFSDGDSPDAFLDWCDAQGKASYGRDWHEVLIALVHTHLLPALREHHMIEVSPVDTCHNPIRAVTVDGEDVSELWTVSSFELPLTPDYVDVPMAEVWRLAAGGSSS